MTLSWIKVDCWFGLFVMAVDLVCWFQLLPWLICCVRHGASGWLLSLLLMAVLA